MRQIRIGPRHPQPPTPLAAGREQSRGGEANASARSPLCHALPPVSVSGRVWGCLVRTPMTKKGTRPTRAQTRPRRELVSERGSGTPGSATQPSVKSGIRHGGLGSCRMGTCVAPDSAARPYKLGRPRSAACVRRHVAGERVCGRPGLGSRARVGSGTVLGARRTPCPEGRRAAGGSAEGGLSDRASVGGGSGGLDSLSSKYVGECVSSGTPWHAGILAGCVARWHARGVYGHGCRHRQPTA